ncbi:hypothetical protein [Pilibacter termitis]|uniref:hypothetical protein n=1 Tax=Pilibacter termitis TaxID=263852 RepID=UPI00099AA2E2|nr:hypothetical protein [Pilibacter termitis]
MSHSIYLLETKFPVLLRTATKILPLGARQRKATRGVQELVVVSHSIYLLETKFPVLLRTATKLLPLIARQRKAKRGG